MIPESPFLFSIAALSASLAGLAGLVAGLRRGTDMPVDDLFRLREIVEFCFANVLIALAVTPLAVGLADVGIALRVISAVALGYLIVVAVFLRLRQQRLGVPASRSWYIPVLVINGLAIVAALATIATGSIAPFEALLVILLARPMVAFLFVLQSFETR